MKQIVFIIICILALSLLNCIPPPTDNNSLPGVPDAPVLSLPSNGSVDISKTPTLTWATVSGAATYRVQVSTISAFTTTVINDSSLTGGSKTLTTALSSKTKYYWRANAKNSAGTSAWSTAWSFTTDNNSLPGVPNAPVLSLPSNGTVDISLTPTLTWGTVSGAATYRVQVSTISTFATTVINDSSLTIESKTLTTALSSKTKYYWRANAKNSAGTSTWSAVWSFITITSSSNTTVTDADGNVYHTITIGTQTWTVENLRTTKYNDGTAIPNVTNTTSWRNLTTPGYCWYNNDSTTYKATYGALYNWYAVNTGKLAPVQAGMCRRMQNGTPYRII